MDVGVLSTTQLQEMCSIWDVDPASTQTTDWTSDIPTVLLSGVNDPVTPPEYGDLALSQLRMRPMWWFREQPTIPSIIRVFMRW